MLAIEEYRDMEKSDFEKKQRWYVQSRSKANPTGVYSIVKIMSERPEHHWWWSWEFIGKQTRDGYYLSHRAPARASDLASFHPDIVEGRKIGKFAIYRLRRENQKLIDEFLNTHKYPCRQKKQSP